jgi:hypothetical protein
LLQVVLERFKSFKTHLFVAAAGGRFYEHCVGQIFFNFKIYNLWMLGTVSRQFSIPAILHPGNSPDTILFGLLNADPNLEPLILKHTASYAKLTDTRCIIIHQ